MPRSPALSLSLSLSLIVLLCLCIPTAAAADDPPGAHAPEFVPLDDDVIDAGSCGTDLTWTLYASGELCVTGSGMMTDFTFTSNAPWYTYRSQITSVVIEPGATSIGDYAFYGCSGLTGVIIPDGVTSIGSEAFRDCSSLIGVAIPDGVTSIGGEAFFGCSSLTGVTIPDSITFIGSHAFFGCSGLTGVYISDLAAWCRIKFLNYNSNPLFYANALYLNNELVTSLVIPDSVTSIGLGTFAGCSGLTVITIPDGVTSIGDYAFYKCTSLTGVTIPDNVTSIGSGTFADCSGLTVITIPDGITSIGREAFYNCSRLTTVTIPDGVTRINDYTFYGCSSLTGITIPDGVTYIGSYAFSGCSSLTGVYISDLAAWCRIYFSHADSNPLGHAHLLYLNNELITRLVIPNGVTSIGTYAFYGCFSLTGVTIPDGVTSIGGYAFYNCSRLTSVAIPDSVTSIGTYAFKDCSELISIAIPDSVTSIGDYTFYNCSELTSITIPDSIISIGRQVFSGCSNLAGVYISDLAAWCRIKFSYYTSNPLFYASALYLNNELVTSLASPNGVTSIGDYAFAGYKGLTTITISGGVTSIGSYAFYNCTGLTCIAISDSVIFIGDYACDNCSSLENVYYDGAAQSEILLGSRNITLSDAVWHYNCAVDVVAGAVTNGTIVLPPRVAYGETFSVVWSTEDGYVLDHLTVDHGTANGDQITVDAEGDFDTITVDAVFRELRPGYAVIQSGSCGTKLSWYLYEDGELHIAGIGDMTNWPSSSSPWSAYRTQITSVVLHPGVTSIGSYAFYDLSGFSFTKMTAVSIPDSVTSIGDNAFDACSKLTGVYISDLAAWCRIRFSTPTSSPLRYAHLLYLNNVLVTRLVIPNGITSIGSSAFYGCSGLTDITIPDGVTSIGTYAFRGCSSLTDITIPDGVTSIGDGAFYGCSGLAGITIPDGVTSIGDGAFYGCSGLAGITIPDSVTSIGARVFSGCSNLAGITIPNSVTVIGSQAFYDCSGLTDVTIPNGITSIGNGAFRHCSSLTGVTIPDGITSIGDSVFSSCSKLTDIIIPDSVTSIGDYAFNGCSSLKNVYYGGASQSELQIGSDNTALTNAVWHYNCAVDVVAGAVTNGTIVLPLRVAYGETFSVAWSTEDGYVLDHLTVDHGTANGDQITVDAEGDFDTITVGAVFRKLRAGTIRQSGACGPNLNWYLYSDGELHIVGTGEMTNWINGVSVPWYSSRESVKSVVIHAGVTTIGDCAFISCAKLTGITIPGSITTIGKYVFCDALVNVYISDLAAWCQISFKLGNPLDSGAKLYINGVPVTSLVIPDSITAIGGYAFCGCRQLTSVIIPDSVTAIGNGAFGDCTGLTTITIPDGVTSIGGSAFYGCSGLTSITIPASVTTIGEYAFNFCTALKYVCYGGTSPEEIDIRSGNDPLTSAIWYSGSRPTEAAPDEYQTALEQIQEHDGALELRFLLSVPEEEDEKTVALIVATMQGAKMLSVELVTATVTSGQNYLDAVVPANAPKGVTYKVFLLDSENQGPLAAWLQLTAGVPGF